MKRNNTNRKQIEEEIASLARRVRILCPDHRDPHRFHEEKSEIAHELNRLAERVAIVGFHKPSRVLPGRNVYGSA